MSGRAVEAAGDVDVLLLDKTGTITYGNRQASELPPSTGRGWGDGATPRCSPPSPTRRRRGVRSSSPPCTGCTATAESGAGGTLVEFLTARPG